MDGTNKIVDDILGQFTVEISKIEKIEPTFVKKLSELLNDDKAITAAKLEQALYEEVQTL